LDDVITTSQIMPNLMKYVMSFSHFFLPRIISFVTYTYSLRSRASAENFSEWGQRKKDRKLAKKGRIIALLILFLLYLYRVWKSRGATAPPCLPLATPMFGIEEDYGQR